jgi:hypothetical protein
MNTDKRQSTSSNASRTAQASGCCGGPAPSGVSACCAQDAEVKATGGRGCGCGSASEDNVSRKNVCCG